MRSNPATIVLFGAIAALYFAREILIPLAFALTLTFLLSPLVSTLERLRMGRVVAALATVAIFMAAAAGTGWVIGNQLIDVANQLPQYRENIQAKIAAFHVPSGGGLAHASESVQEVVKELTTPSSTIPAAALAGRRKKLLAAEAPQPVRVVEGPTSGWSTLRDLGGPILAPVARTGMILIFTIFMLLKREDLRNRVLRLAGLGQLNLMTQALDDASRRVSRYLLMQFLVNAGFGALFGLGLYCIGVPYPALWGVVAGLLRIVPYIGTIAAAVMPIVMSLAVFDGWHKPLLVFALVAGLELITGNALEPWLYGTHVGISGLAVLVTSIFWAVLWGPAGLILATPLTVCLVVLGRYVPQLAFLHILLGDEPVLTPDAQIYQRLLAMDQAEAQGVVSQFLKDRTVSELYDSVFIPALSLAEADRHKGAIDADREEFLFLSVNEMIAEFSEYPAEQAERVGLDHRIICLPAHDRADELTGAMLAQLLDRKGFATLSFPLGDASPVEMLERLQVGGSDIVCICSLPPYAFAPARALCRQIRERFPKLKVIVCVCGYSGDTDKAKARFERTPPECLCVSLADAVENIESALRPVEEATPSVA